MSPRKAMRLRQKAWMTAFNVQRQRHPLRTMLLDLAFGLPVVVAAGWVMLAYLAFP